MLQEYAYGITVLRGILVMLVIPFVIAGVILVSCGLNRLRSWYQHRLIQRAVQGDPRSVKLVTGGDEAARSARMAKLAHLAAHKNYYGTRPSSDIDHGAA